jgi:phage FluMu gp28-like protein
MFPRLRQAFAAPVRIRIPLSVDVREDLHQMRQIISGGQYSYSAPHTAEGHSDRCTALALAWRAASMTGAGSFFVPIPTHRADRSTFRPVSRRKSLGTLP